MSKNVKLRGNLGEYEGKFIYSENCKQKIWNKVKILSEIGED